MKSYSAMRMREEKKPLFRLLAAYAALCLLAAAVFGALWRVGKESALIFALVFLALFLVAEGLYLVASDEKWLMKKTVYGRALLRYGAERCAAHDRMNAEDAAAEIMADIDGEARQMRYVCSGFALTEHWMILYQRSARSGVVSLPVPRRIIRKISWEPMRREENSEYLVRVYVEGSDEPHQVRAFELADIQALRQWGAIQERQDL